LSGFPLDGPTYNSTVGPVMGIVNLKFN
jgi:hypothetical protein